MGWKTKEKLVDLSTLETGASNREQELVDNNSHLRKLIEKMRILITHEQIKTDIIIDERDLP